jgi:hypothetical protein
LQKNYAGDVYFDPKVVTFRLNDEFLTTGLDIRSVS